MDIILIGRDLLQIKLLDFYKNEIAPIREITPNIPVTTNFMGDYPRMSLFNGLDYW